MIEIAAGVVLFTRLKYTSQQHDLLQLFPPAERRKLVSKKLDNSCILSLARGTVLATS